MKTKHVGTCAVCGSDKELTFEHYPPKASGNDSPIKMQDYRHLTPLGGHLYGKKSRSPRGFGGYKLCAECNSFTGGQYVDAYTEVAKRTKQEFQEIAVTEAYLKFTHTIQPLNFIKQVFTIHLCLDQAAGVLRSELNSRELILNKECDDVPKNVRLYMYATRSKTHRAIGIAVTNLSEGIGNYSEFNFRPLGFFLSISGPVKLRGMKDITHFLNYSYDEYEDEDFTLPILKVENMIMGDYR